MPLMIPSLLIASCRNMDGSGPDAWPSGVRANTPNGIQSALSGGTSGALATIDSACWAYTSAEATG